MNKQLRTSTVVALCKRMLDSRQFDIMPILADALQDAGCDDKKLLAQCQNPKLQPVQAERLVNLIYSDKTAAAVRWLEQFVRDINYNDYKDENDEVGTPSDTDPHDYAYIIQSGHQGVEEGHMYFGSDAGAEFFWDDNNRKEFFRNWSLVTGVKVSEKDQKKINFSCAC